MTVTLEGSALWVRQIRAMLALELRRTLWGRRAFMMYLLAALPIVPLLLPEYQMSPFGPSVMLCGRAVGSSRYSFISPVRGSSMPTRLPYMPAHQIVPSRAINGSRGRWPSVGAFHSLNAICVSPSTSFGVYLPVAG